MTLPKEAQAGSVIHSNTLENRDTPEDRTPDLEDGQEINENSYGTGHENCPLSLPCIESNHQDIGVNENVEDTMDAAQSLLLLSETLHSDKEVQTDAIIIDDNVRTEVNRLKKENESLRK